MRILNHAGRLVLGRGPAEGVDVAAASGGRFEADIQLIYERWAEFTGWARQFDGRADVDIDPLRLGPPVPRPAQIFGVGLNYRDHAEEAGLAVPDRPVIFTKFPASVTGPVGAIERVDGSVDFETELVAVIGRRAHRVAEAEAWDFVAGLTGGQDLSERELQWAGTGRRSSSAWPSRSPASPRSGRRW